MSAGSKRLIVGYIYRDDISWWAGCRYEGTGPGYPYIRETSAMTRWGARFLAKRLARDARRLREQKDFRVELSVEAPK